MVVAMTRVEEQTIPVGVTVTVKSPYKEVRPRNSLHRASTEDSLRAHHFCYATYFLS